MHHLPFPYFIGTETVQQATKVFYEICDKFPESTWHDRVHLFSEIYGFELTERPVYQCQDCSDGRLHSPGLWKKLPGKQLSLGGPLICDSCGRYTAHKLIRLYG